MPKFTRTHNILAWGGTTKEVGDIGRSVRRLMSEAINEEITLHMTVERPGREDEFDTPEDFERGVGGDLRSIRCIVVSGTPNEHSYPWKVNAYITFNKRMVAPVWMSIDGTAEVIVHGIAQALEKQLDEGRRRLRFPLPMVVPALELRREGDPTRLQRLGRPLRWLAATGVVALIGAIVAKLVS